MSAWQYALAAWAVLLGLFVALRIHAVLARERRARKYAHRVMARIQPPATRDITPDPRGLHRLRAEINHARTEDKR